MAIGLIIGTTLGVISGYKGGAIDNAVMFLVDVQQAVPFIVLALAVLAIFGTDLWVLIGTVGLAGWDNFARFSRGMTLSVRESQYVLASQAVGASHARLMIRHILPNVAAPLIVLATLNISGIILLESSLSFLGIGVQPPQPSWGSMIGEGRAYLNTAWWIAVMPGVAIVATTMSVNLVGDWLRDVLDPTLKKGGKS
jgi:peptide/nickel transport system permease protein